MHHAIKTGKRCAVALIAVRVEFLLREDISTSLDPHQRRPVGTEWWYCFKAREPTYLARERDHPD